MRLGLRMRTVRISNSWSESGGGGRGGVLHFLVLRYWDAAHIDSDFQKFLEFEIDSDYQIFLDSDFQKFLIIIFKKFDFDF